MNPHGSPQRKTPPNGVSAIVVHYGPPDLALGLVGSLARHDDASLISELIIVDNGGGLCDTDRGKLTRAASPMPIRFVATDGTSYSGGVNAGVASSTGQNLLVMNNDLVWEKDQTVSPLIEAMNSDAVGIAGPQLLNDDGSWQRSYGSFPSLSSATESLLLIDTLKNTRAARRFVRRLPDTTRSVDYVDGAMMCVQRRCFEETGGLDETMPFYGEDTDFCHRARRAGWTVMFVPSARVVHLRGATSTKDDPARFERKLFSSKVRFVKRTSGTAKAQRYARLLRAALAVRAWLYPLAAAISRTESARARATAARERYAAVREMPTTVPQTHSDVTP